MVNRRKKNRNSRASIKEFVTVAFAEDMELAKQYKELLEEEEIPCAIKTPSDNESGYPGIAVMVPEDYLDEAHIKIESQGTYNDFYDMAFHDDNEDQEFDEYDEF